MAKNALESASTLLTNIDVTEVIATGSQIAGDVSRVVLQITGLYDGRAFRASSGNFTISVNEPVVSGGLWDVPWDVEWV